MLGHVLAGKAARTPLSLLALTEESKIVSVSE